MTKEQRKKYNAEKQRLYRKLTRGKEARKYEKSEHYQDGRMTIEQIMTAAGHCGFCGCLLSSEWHDKHPLVGCERYIREYHQGVPPRGDESPKLV
jgi:hypothetical protein